MRVYIAGPMTDYPQFNIPAFDAAAEGLRSRGLEVVSPAELDEPDLREALLRSPAGDPADFPPGYSWGRCLARDFAILAEDGIDAVVTLPGWEESGGAPLEVAWAARLGIPHADLGQVFGFTSGDSPEGRVGFVLDSRPLASILADPRGGEDAGHPGAGGAGRGADHADAGKPRVDLIPGLALVPIADVLEYGTRKYAPHNWRGGIAWSRFYGSLLRHLYAWWEGEDLDPESGLPHLGHAGCDLLFLLEYDRTGTGEDDRWRPRP